MIPYGEMVCFTSYSKLGLTNFVNIIRNVYKNLSFHINMQEGLSTLIPSNVGLKQGCNLSPMLFNIFINDLVDDLKMHQTDAPLLFDLPVSCLLYADDLVLLSETANGLQSLLNVLDTFCKKWFLTVNLPKTKCLVFSKTNSVFSQDTFLLGTNKLMSSQNYCYLGTNFNANCSLKENGEILNKKANGAYFSLYNKILKFDVKCNRVCYDLFDRIIKPVSLYNSEIWGPDVFPTAKGSQLFDLDKLHNLPFDKTHLKFLRYHFSLFTKIVLGPFLPKQVDVLLL